MDFKKYTKWCNDNGFDPKNIDAKRAFEAAHSTGEKKRKHERKEVTLLCLGRSAEGEVLFKRATVPNLKSVKEHTAWVLSMEAIEAGLENPSCVTVQEQIDLD